ncbi:hypothetical protein LCGC14_1167830 [marine sediment metagenome]|uniref:Uncharacterized protein n=1 Tax=marine sediment metagenome TaxID=412755 RepID=A0A0F9LQV0_9ZZZZ
MSVDPGRIHFSSTHKPKPDPECGRCGDAESYHRIGGQCDFANAAGGWCACPKFQRKRNASRASTRRQAKSVERDWAEALGGRRVPAGVAAQQRQGDADVVSPNRILQVKHRAVPGWFNDGWDQANQAKTGTGKRALLCITTKGQSVARHYVVEERSEWLKWNGRDDYEE